MGKTLRGALLADERGQSIGTKIGMVVVLALVVIIPWKFGIPIYKHMQMSSQVQKLTNWDLENRTAPLPDGVMMDKMLHRARELNLPITKENIKISHPTHRTIRIVVEYNYPYDVPFFPQEKIRRIDHLTER